MINLELYKIFLEVAETGSITKAANNLHISQPAVTKHIKNLESELGGSLFIRTNSGMILNNQGNELYIYIKQALILINTGETKFLNLEKLEKGTIKIGISTTLTRKFLFKYIKKFRKMYPNIVVEIDTDPTFELIKKMKQGKIDFIIAKIIKQNDKELSYDTLGEMQDIFVVNEDYKELINKEINIDEIVSYPLLIQTEPSNSRESFDFYCKDNNIKLNATMNIASSSLLVDFIKAGYGIGFITKEYIDDELENNILYELQITPKVTPNKYGIIKLKNSFLSFCSEEFLKIIKENNT